jgi:nucleoid DNA-binding protein
MGKLTIQEIAKILVEKSGLSQKDANRFASEMFAIIQQRLEEDELVKIKGLGTFKIINVEARESVSVRTGERVVIDSHAKVTFTPDAVMKELVNKPFSQFETVVLNDGVEFEDVAEDSDEDNAKSEEKAIASDEESAEEVFSGEEPLSEEQPIVMLADVEPVVEEPVVEKPVVEESVVEEPVVEEPVVEEPETEEATSEEPVVEENPEGSSWKKWLLSGVLVLVLMGLSALGGYYYAMYKLSSQKIINKEEIKKEKVVPLSKTTDSTVVAKDTVAAKSPEKAEAPDLKAESSPVKDETADKKVKEDAEEVDPYEAKDERIRLGAYKIVGTAEEVTVLPGQTFYSICRAHLGPDMQCYVEVYNNLPKDPKIKVGQVIKIPKLKTKKRRKR